MDIAAFDLDGTLLFDRVITAQTVEAVSQWRAAGNLAVAATGKSLDSCRRALLDNGVHMDYLVLYNGTVLATGEGRVLCEDRLPAPLVDRVVEKLRGTDNLNLYVTTVDGPDALVLGTVDDRKNSIITNVRRLPPEQLAQEKVVLISAWSPGGRKLQQEIERWVKSEFEVSTSINSGFLDIMPPGHTKAAGIKRLLEHLGLRRQQVRIFSFGDSHNDLPMHSLADISFSFPHADPEVQEAVDYVVADAVTGLQMLGRLSL
ncbi:hypothetical protein CPHO_07365 [Corynebacterium phocae]|uniref:Haloacid dehalogenase n=2 Tax=Corynebacterium phocae TaxID=161895 RepID=A0A1L7D3N6_9CORY|nr:hypothetical protein CPHO_07365 [Corynebacterium phocae]